MKKDFAAEQQAREDKFRQELARMSPFAVEVYSEIVSRLLGQKLDLYSTGIRVPADIRQVGAPGVREGIPQLLFDVQWDDGHIEFLLELLDISSAPRAAVRGEGMQLNPAKRIPRKLGEGSEAFEQARARSARFIEEAFMEITSRLLNQDLTLYSGRKPMHAQILPIGGPSGEDGNLTQLFAVDWDGGHMEWRLSKSGWGGSIPQEQPEMQRNPLRKNAPLEANNVAILLEHIPVGSSRHVHSLNVKRVEADHYSIDGGSVIDLSDAINQIGAYSGKAHNPQDYFFVPGQTVEVRPHNYPGWVFRGIVGVQFADEEHLKPHQPKEWALKYAVSSKDGEDLGMYDASEIRSTDLLPQTIKQAYQTYPKEMLAAHQAKIALNRAMGKLAGEKSGGKAGRVFPGKFPPGHPMRNPDEEILNMKQNPVTRAPNRTARQPKGHYYKVLDRKGRVIAFTTTKAEAESVCPAGGRVQHL